MMGALISGLVGSVVAALLGAAALRSLKPASTDEDGWKRLRPSWHSHLILVLCIALLAVMALFFAIGGSARADAGRQNVIALLLLVSFGATAVWIVWSAYVRRIEWKDNEVRVRTPFGDSVCHRLSDIVSVSESFDGFQSKLHFTNGRMLRVNSYSHGFRDFMDALPDRT